jgi:Family of unknown function (DUF6585)
MNLSRTYQVEEPDEGLDEGIAYEGIDPLTLDLGKVIATHQGRGFKYYQIITRLIPLFLLFLLPILYGLRLGYFGFTQYGLVAAATWSTPWLITGGSFFLILVIWLVLQRQNRHKFVRVHQNGIHACLGGRLDQITLWKELSGIRYEGTRVYLIVLPLPTKSRLTILPASGRPLSMDDRINHLDQLINTIKDHYYPVILPRLRQQFYAGHLVPFGPIGLLKSGLKIKNRLITWDDMDEFRVERGVLSICLHTDKSIKIPTVKIPNPELLLKLVNERRI